MVTRVGNDDPNTLNGTSDNDVLSGKGGSDNLYGFAGDDIFDPGTNPVGFVSPDYIDGGDGYDRLNFHPHRADGTIESVGLNFFVSGIRWIVNSFGPAHFLVMADNMEYLSFTGGTGR